MLHIQECPNLPVLGVQALDVLWYFWELGSWNIILGILKLRGLGMFVSLLSSLLYVFQDRNVKEFPSYSLHTFAEKGCHKSRE